MFFDNAEGMVFRPPSEAKSLILRITIGCSHNACSFCAMYRGVKFRVRSQQEIASLIETASRYYPDTRRIFLADGNALVLSNDRLLPIMQKLHAAFPKLARITCYGGPKDILNKSVEELAQLKTAGLQIIYLGIESGDDETLSYVNKGVSAAEMIEAGQKVLAAGIKLSAMLILGLGGRERSRQHALNSARVVNAINPTMLSALTLMLHHDTPLRAAADRGEFQPLSAYELMLELKTMLAAIDVSEPCIFRSNHVSNLLPLAGTLPKDKEALLSDVSELIDYLKDKGRTPLYNDTGDF
ncbi:MAG: radical SAM protein [Negativicutes bacterium]|nr:radical SAM protein [Negativicutes bacterium]